MSTSDPTGSFVRSLRLSPKKDPDLTVFLLHLEAQGIHLPVLMRNLLREHMEKTDRRFLDPVFCREMRTAQLVSYHQRMLQRVVNDGLAETSAAVEPRPAAPPAPVQVEPRPIAASAKKVEPRVEPKPPQASPPPKETVKTVVAPPPPAPAPATAPAPSDTGGQPEEKPTGGYGLKFLEDS